MNAKIQALKLPVFKHSGFWIKSFYWQKVEFPFKFNQGRIK